MINLLRMHSQPLLIFRQICITSLQVKRERDSIKDVALKIIRSIGALIELLITSPLITINLIMPKPTSLIKPSKRPHTPCSKEEHQMKILFDQHILKDGTKEQVNPFRESSQSFSTLPPELLNNILMELNIDSFINLKLTCQASSRMEVPRYVAKNINAN